MKKMETARLFLRQFRESDYKEFMANIYADEAVRGAYSGSGRNPVEAPNG